MSIGVHSGEGKPQRPQQCTAASRRTQEHVAVGVVQRMKDLRLDGIKVQELGCIQAFERLVLQRCNRQRLKAQQVRVLAPPRQ
jgi:hypothetical protein